MAAIAPLPVVPLLETQGLVKRFGGLAAVSDVSLSVAAGEIRAIIGPNGAGKSTLVGIVCGRLAPTEGRVRYRGRDIWWWLERATSYGWQHCSVRRRSPRSAFP